MSGKRLSREQKEGIVADIRAKKKSFHQISKDHAVAQSTTSRIAAELGLSSPRKKTRPVDVPEHSYDRNRRIAVLDRMTKGIDMMFERGGLSSRQIKDLASAAQSILSTRRQEDIEPEPEKEGEDEIVWESVFAVPDESQGIGLKKGSYLHKAMMEVDEELEREWLEQQPGHPSEAAEYGSSGSSGDK